MWRITHEFKTHYEVFGGIGEPANENARSLLIVFKSNIYQPVPCRPWAFRCRALCGHDLKRPHVTCLAICRLRRVWSGKLQNPIPIERVWLAWIQLDNQGHLTPYNLIILAERRFRIIKRILLERLWPFAIRLPNVPQRKILLTTCEILAS